MKTQIRQDALQRRDSLDSQFVNKSGKKMADIFINSRFSELPENSSIMLYSSFRNEADTWNMINYFHDRNTEIVLPVTKGPVIHPYIYDGEDSLKKDRFGIPSPDESKCASADISKIHTIIVPGVAFTADGNRLGFGKGFYDRFLPQIPNAVKIALCYDFQIVDYIPTEPTDVPVDYLLTEKGIIDCKTQSYIDL